MRSKHLFYVTITWLHVTQQGRSFDPHNKRGGDQRKGRRGQERKEKSKGGQGKKEGKQGNGPWPRGRRSRGVGTRLILK